MQNINRSDEINTNEITKNEWKVVVNKDSYVILMIVNRFQPLNLEESNYEISEGRSEFH
jgi:hypothetical protein